ncbi:hypothetical protein A6X21_05265 [Planctopirus hydrillae]|uniref:Uncharacterized protein n=1 Tax=Planctopirus hydrillae TaxID=1841610 RepID=A0A1C3EC71_9PLAN|nr:hypothetical protein A6X21_05265 [Planctopirus hydrillae]
MHLSSPTQTQFFAPSPVLTGKGCDEGELELCWRSINNRLHRRTLFISGRWMTIGVPADASVTVTHPSAKTLTLPSPTQTRARVPEA